MEPDVTSHMQTTGPDVGRQVKLQPANPGQGGSGSPSGSTKTRARTSARSLAIWFATAALIVVGAVLAPRIANRSANGDPRLAVWDILVYRNAVLSVRAGRDPYRDSTDAQRNFLDHLPEHPHAQPPFAYVYAPMTLPVLRAAGAVPSAVSGTIYWTLYGVAMLAALWVALHFLGPQEQEIGPWLVPLSLFFPGLMADASLWSGNVVTVLYGFVFGGAYVGWARSRWVLFYAAVLLASVVKAPLLVLLAVPVLSGRRQLGAALLTGGIGMALFAVNALVWPALFRSFTSTIAMEYSFPFFAGSGLNTLIARVLSLRLPYRAASIAAYVACVIPLGCVLVVLSRKFLAGRIARKEWVPLMMTGTFLLYPRLIVYDLAPVTPFLAMLVCRALPARFSQAKKLTALVAICVVLTVLGMFRQLTTQSLACSAIFIISARKLYLLADERQRLNAGKPDVIDA